LVAAGIRPKLLPKVASVYQ